ncbi:nucleotidyltransferase family protein [Amycolatopsis sp. NPDC049159]|uniref:nucleotidyltransferase family protein n=1 Tax=Amycolatopsis sp. NPDC049159 TaxID=3157210 RepID=UPI0033F1F76D
MGFDCSRGGSERARAPDAGGSGQGSCSWACWAHDQYVIRFARFFIVTTAGATRQGGKACLDPPRRPCGRLRIGAAGVWAGCGGVGAADLSWEGEDRVIRAAAETFADLGVDVEVRDEARVHLWYEAKFGVACPPFTTTEAAIDAFVAVCSCVGVRLEPGGSWHFYAPHGLDDLFAMVVRPNPVLAPCEACERKVARWRSRWPEIVSRFPARSRMWTSVRSRLWSVVPRSVTP